MYKSLIQKINALLLKEKLQKGEDFNVFKVMHMESDEVYTHSALIAELLNPKGSHGCGDVFLKLFLEQLPTSFVSPFNTKEARSEVEVVIGDISEEEGGRMDVLVQDGKQAIIIENKIYASDQHNQLLRYYNFAQKKFENRYLLLYLTLDGKMPSKDSTGDILKENEDFYCISYAGEIRQWLLLCLEKAVQKPLVREIIIQYLNLLNNLTHQDMENNVKDELMHLCSEPQNMEALLWISKNFSNVIQKIIETKFVPQLQEIADKNSLDLRIKDNGKDWINTPWMGFAFKKKDWHTFEVCFEFQNKSMRNMVSGFRYQDGHRETEKETYSQLGTIELEGKQQSKGWPIFHYFPKRDNNWISETIMSKIENGLLKEEIENELSSLITQAEKLEVHL